MEVSYVNAVPDAVEATEGRWTLWTITFDGWMERVYQNGQLVHEQNNFLMVRPEGHITIGADGSGTNNFMGYIIIRPMMKSVSNDL